MNIENKTIDCELVLISHQYATEESYWLNKFSGEWVKSSFPYDYSKSLKNKPVKESVKSRLTGEIFSMLMRLCKKSDAKLHMTLLAVLVVLLNKYSGNNDIIVGTPIYRQEIEAEFINTVLAIRVPVPNHIPFKDLLLKIREDLVGADTQRNFPLEVLVQKLQIHYTGYTFPLFDAALLIENIQDKKYLDGIQLPLIFCFLRTGESLELTLEYNAALYQEMTVRRIADHFCQALESILQRIDLKIRNIDILPDQEKHHLLVEFNDTGTANRYVGTIHRLFERQVERTPDHVALAGTHQAREKNHPGLSMPYTSYMSYMSYLSYKELNEKSNRLARLLRKNSAATESVVGIMMEPTMEMVIALMAILKAGGAYLPLDPSLPAERVRYMLEDSEAATLVSTSRVLDNIPFTTLQGLESRQGIQVTRTLPRPHIETFDRLPRPDRSLVDLRNYKNKIGMASVTDCISIQSTRGCPYQCLYCHKVWSKHHVHQSAENIYDEILYYYKNGVTNFAFIDDCFNLDRETSSRLFRLISKNHLTVQLFFPNGLRGDIMTPDYIELMVEAGTRGINLSLETASPRLQKLLKKNLDLDKFKQVMDYIARRHPHVILEMASMHGFPGETEEEAYMTLDFIKSIKWLHFPYIHILKIFPNTEMEAFALEQGISKKDIMISKDRAFHELPETLPFPKSFTRKYQADFLNNYFLNKERLMHVLPHQTRVLSETALVQKYNTYLPVEIKSIEDVIEFAELEGVRIPGNYKAAEKPAGTIFDRAPQRPAPPPGAKKILFLDLSQHFSTHSMLYRVVEQPLGLISLLTYLKQQFGDHIDGRIYKAGNDFDSFTELKALVDEYNPQLVGIRTLTFFQEFFHETVSLLRQWGVKAPIITGGPYASSDYDTILKDKHVDLAVLGEGEHTLEQLIREMLGNEFRLPGAEVLDKIQGIAYRKILYGGSQSRQSREIILMDRLESAIKEAEIVNFPSQSNERQLAYVMYTSGSTGTPKGVMVEHRQVNNCISWMQDKFNLGPRDVIANRTDLTFDPSVWEIFWPLYIGGSVKVLDRHQRKDAEFLIRTMAQDISLTMMYCPAPLVNIMVYLLNTKAVKLGLKLPWLIIGAEAISRETVMDFYRYYEGKIVNTYGPTECTINNTYYEIPRDDSRAVVPIGRPVANNRIYILDGNLQPMPIKITGEICIGGDSLARGYINNPEKTRGVFIKNSYGKGMLYRTGDMGRWHEDGTIEIVGRKDEQMKIRGYRIEPAEIEKALLAHPLVKESVVVVRDHQTPAPQVKRCVVCGITTKYPQVTIDEQGLCNICGLYRQYKPYIDGYFRTPQQLEQTIKEIKGHQEGRYDCMLLYAGGKGAAYALYRLVEMGFKVLAATYDNGYFGKAHIKNIKRITASLGVDHVVLTHRHSDHILGESIKVAATVCRGCFHTSTSLAAEYAYTHHIPVVMGATLSRGQIIENKLMMFLLQGITDAQELEKEIANLQRSAPAIDRSIFEYIDIEVVKNGTVHETVKFLDFYRYCNVTNGEMSQYLDRKDPYWKTRKNNAIYSTNCPIKQVGDFGHLEEKGYHYYGGATSWEKRLEHLTLQNLERDLTCKVSPRAYHDFLKRIGRGEEKQDRPVKMQDKYICAYYVVDPVGISQEKRGVNELSAVDLREYLVKKVPAYMIPAYFVQLERIPLTANGKIDKNGLPAPELERSKSKVTYVAPKSDIEKMIADTWKEVLKVAMPGLDDNFFDLGGDSLKATILVSRIQVALKVKMPLTEVFKSPTIRAMAEFMKGTFKSIKKTEEKEYYEFIEVAEEREYYPLSPAQQGIFVQQQMQRGMLVYNMPHVFPLHPNLDRNQLQEILRKMIKRHHSLRTSFHLVGNKAVQRVHKEVDFEIEYYDLNAYEKNNKLDNTNYTSIPPKEAEGDQLSFILRHSLIRPFDLSRAPLFRVGLIKTGEGKYILMMDIHHIITDGISNEIFGSEVLALYNGQQLPPLLIQYKDYAVWHNTPRIQEDINRQKEYWLNKFKQIPLMLKMPLDFKRPAFKSYDGDIIRFTLKDHLTRQLQRLAEQTGTTLYMILLSTYFILLFKYNNQEDIVVGSTATGRKHASLQHIIGMFVNMMVIRGQPQREKTLRKFLEEVKLQVIDSIENQDYHYNQLVQDLGLRGNPSRNPLFDVVFNIGTVDSQKPKEQKGSLESPEVGDNSTAFEHKIIPYDLMLGVFEINGMLKMCLAYSTALFNRSTVERMTEHYTEILEQVTNNHNDEIKLGDISISHHLIVASSKDVDDELEQFEFI